MFLRIKRKSSNWWKNVRTNKKVEDLILTTGEDHKMIVCKTDAYFIADSPLRDQKQCNEALDQDPLYRVSLPSYAYVCELHEGKQEVEYMGAKNIYVLIQIGLRGRLSGLHRPRYFETDAASELTHDKTKNS